jgi:hypothetical protein
MNFLEASQQLSFLQGKVAAPRPTPIPEDKASVFISPRGRVATHFSRLLRHPWPTTSNSTSVGTAIRPRAGRSRFYFLAGAGNLSLRHHVQNDSGAHQISFSVYRFSPWVQSGRVDHSPPSNEDDKNPWRYTSTPQYVFMAWCIVKHRDKFTLYLVQIW